MPQTRLLRGPTIAEIARAAGVGTATVDRVLNARESVRPATREKVLAALETLKSPPPPPARQRRIAFVSESGPSFNKTLQTAVAQFGAANPTVACSFVGLTSVSLKPVDFARTLEQVAQSADGLAVVAREDLTINRTLRTLAARNLPIVCLTTDLPNSGRLAYVGSDNFSAGATAAYLMGRLVGTTPAKILLVVSAAYRVQEDREMGFRRVLRTEFSHLAIEDRVNSNDDAGHLRHEVLDFIKLHGPPAGIYNVAAGNVGVGQALQESGLTGRTIFIGHELNANSRMLLESGQMDLVIGHDVPREVALSVECILATLENRKLPPMPSIPVQICTKYNCG